MEQQQWTVREAAAVPGASLVGLGQGEGIVSGASDIDQRVAVPAAGAKEVEAGLVDLGRHGAKHDCKAAVPTGPHGPDATSGPAAAVTGPKRKSTRVAVKCGRCDGAGAIASFTARFSGKCFACDGSGTRWMSRAAFDKKQGRLKEHEAYFAAQRALHPICKTCGYAMGGADGYTEKACKCGHTEVNAITAAP